MRFSEIKYVRPDLSEVKAGMEALLDEMKMADSAEKQIDQVENIYKLRARFETMSNVASIRHTIDTTDTFYEEEQRYFDLNYPIS